MCAVKRVLVVSHADADGHIIAEQVRRNLAMVSTFEVSTVVDPARTRDHHAWTKLDAIPEIERCDIVFFVDLMFAPTSFAAEAGALVEFATDRPQKRFFVMDHHPIPQRLLRRAPNLRPVYRPDVFDCTLGRASRLMVIAALIEKQPTRVRAERTAKDEILAKGIRRAAALGGPLPGEKLSALMRFDYWSALAELGEDDPLLHRLPRGRRAANESPPKLLSSLDKLATELLTGPTVPGDRPPRRSPMSYDLQSVPVSDREPPEPRITNAGATDLEAIMTLIELAAISLTEDEDSDFTIEQLIEQARELAGDDFQLVEGDVKLVVKTLLAKNGFLKRKKGRPGRLCLK